MAPRLAPLHCVPALQMTFTPKRFVSQLALLHGFPTLQAGPAVTGFCFKHPGAASGFAEPAGFIAQVFWPRGWSLFQTRFGFADGFRKVPSVRARWTILRSVLT